MSDTEYDLDDPRDVRRMMTDVERRNIQRILDQKLETDDDYAELAKLVEDESDESDTWVDHDFDFGPGN